MLLEILIIAASNKCFLIANSSLLSVRTHCSDLILLWLSEWAEKIKAINVRFRSNFRSDWHIEKFWNFFDNKPVWQLLRVMLFHDWYNAAIWHKGFSHRATTWPFDSHHYVGIVFLMPPGLEYPNDSDWHPLIVPHHCSTIHLNLICKHHIVLSLNSCENIIAMKRKI